jgi:hypothetical protein
LRKSFEARTGGTWPLSPGQVYRRPGVDIAAVLDAQRAATTHALQALTELGVAGRPPVLVPASAALACCSS